jgi:hypothetical protein
MGAGYATEDTFEIDQAVVLFQLRLGADYRD